MLEILFASIPVARMAVEVKFVKQVFGVTIVVKIVVVSIHKTAVHRVKLI